MSRELITSWEYLSLFAETDRWICRNYTLSKLGYKGAINKSLFYLSEVNKGTGNVFVHVSNSRCNSLFSFKSF